VAVVRKRLAEKNQVHQHAPIEIVGELWIKNDQAARRVILGMATPLSHKGYRQWGIRLSALTAFLENEVLLEGLMVHEFLHCFHKMREVIVELKHGNRELEDHRHNPYSREDDDRLLAPAADWFHEEIDFPHANDPRGLEAIKYLVRELREELPIRTPPHPPKRQTISLMSSLRQGGCHVSIPHDIQDHVELLLSRH
jgi:hypothetical protein